MRMTRRLTTVLAAVIGACAAPVVAAAPAQLEIGATTPGGAGGPAPIEIASWSWGATNTSTTASGGGTGKVAVQDLSVTKVDGASAGGADRAPAGTSAGKVNVQDLSVMKAREAGSGMASGRRAVAADAAAPAATPRVGDLALLTLVVADTPAAAALVKACGSGEHLPSVALSSDGHRYQLADAVVTSCTAQSGQRLLGVRGHVTLIK